jgi:hypothetical protein
MVFVAACGGGGTAITAEQATGDALSGVFFEVHENPG